VKATTLTELLDERAVATPTGIAFMADGQAVTWREFADRAGAFAMALGPLGVGCGDAVAVIGLTSVQWAIADLGILAAGGVCVGIYPSLPTAQVASVLRDCGAKIVIAGSRADLEVVEAVRPEVPGIEQVIGWGDAQGFAPLSFDSLVREGRRRAESAPSELAALKRRAAADDAALVVYTSGTTGELKGAVLSHRNCVAAVEGAMAAATYAGEGDLAVSFLPMAHVAEHIALYGRIATGMATRFVGSLDGRTIAETVMKTRPTLFGAVPLVFEKARATIAKRLAAAPAPARVLFGWAERVGRQMSRCLRGGRSPSPWLRIRYAVADALVFRRLRAAFGGRVRYFLCGAAPIDPRLLEFFHGAGMLILEAYGLTEFSGIATMNRPDAFRFGTVGLPLPGVEVRIASDGEVLLRGPSVFRGYLNRPDETAKTVDAEGWVHTGDVGELDAAGFLRLTDRKKNLLATAGGKKVAPARIESLVDEPLVASLVVVGDGRSYVAALVALDAEAASVAAQEVEARVRRALELANAGLAPFERVRRATILPRPLSIAAGELTPTLKVRRPVVLERYRDEIDRLYEDPIRPGVIEIVPSRA
jgi:long-chain acyl-CoA synthetase